MDECPMDECQRMSAALRALGELATNFPRAA
jgi:hypothetical protein